MTMPLLTADELERMSPLFKGRLGKAIADGLMHVLSVDEVNDLYDRHKDQRGVDFADAVLKDVGVGHVLSMLPTLPDGPFITVSNHPCGHLDGVLLIDIFGHIRQDYKVMVNGVLSRIEPLKENFISVTPVGNDRGMPTAVSIKGVKEALVHLRSGGALGLFPAGAVSDLSIRDGCVRDRQWQEPVIRLIMKAGVPVVPVRFFDGNSFLYYALGCMGWRVRLLRLPAEVFNKRGRKIRVGIGPVVTPEQIAGFGNDVLALRDYLRSCVYDMDWPD